MVEKKISKKDVKNEEQKTKPNRNGEEAIFRKSSLDKLASPEHLDKLIQVTDSKGWLSLIGAIFLIIVTVIWSVIGTLPTKVSGIGILIKSGGLKNIQHIYGGTITDLTIKDGDEVERGDVIGRLSATDILTKISSSKFELQILKDNLVRYEKYAEDNSGLKKGYFELEREKKSENLNDVLRDIVDQKKKLDAQKLIFDKGGISSEELRISQQQLDQLETIRDNIQNELKQLTMEELAYNKQHKDTIVNMAAQVEEKHKEILFLQDQLDEKSKIVSPFSGRVVSVDISKGDLIGAGQNLATIEISGKDVKNLEAVMFIPAIEAKKIELGMEAQITPSTVNPSEYGVLLGNVTKVSEYPTSYQYMAKTLGETLAKTYANMPNPIEVLIDLIPDNKNTSGYKWSSKNGPPIAIKTGTPAISGITVKKQKPITFVFPILSKILD